MLPLVTLCSVVGYAICGSVDSCISRCDFMDGQCTQAIINPDGSCLTTSKSPVHYGGKGRYATRRKTFSFLTGCRSHPKDGEGNILYRCMTEPVNTMNWLEVKYTCLMAARSFGNIRLKWRSNWQNWIDLNWIDILIKKFKIELNLGIDWIHKNLHN